MFIIPVKGASKKDSLFVMTKSSALTPALAQFVRKAKMLREWARFGIFEMSSPRNQLYEHNNGISHDAINSRIHKIVQEHRARDKFFSNIGLPPLPKSHPMVRAWDDKLTRMRRTAEKGKRKGRPPGRKAYGATKQKDP